MNYSLDNLPNSGENPIVSMDIRVGGQELGRIFIRLFREVFPAGVENFAKIAEGRTFRVEKKGIGKYTYRREVRRTYSDCKFFNFLYNNYAVTGDIYNNNGTSAGTIYCDQPIPAYYANFYYPHDAKGLISLVPYKDPETGRYFFDSTFMILLQNINPGNAALYTELDREQIVIGQIYNGLPIIDKINELVLPFAGRKYPTITIGKSDLLRTTQAGLRRRRPLTVRDRQRLSACCPYGDNQLYGNQVYIKNQPPYPIPIDLGNPDNFDGGNFPLEQVPVVPAVPMVVPENNLEYAEEKVQNNSMDNIHERVPIQTIQDPCVVQELICGENNKNNIEE